MVNDLSKGATFAADEFTENTDYHDLVDNGGVTAIDRDGFNRALATPVTVGTPPASPSDNEFILDDGLNLQRFDLANAVFIDVDVNTASSLLVDMKVKAAETIAFRSFVKFNSSIGMEAAVGDSGERNTGICTDFGGAAAGITASFTNVGFQVIRTGIAASGTWSVRNDFLEVRGGSPAGVAARATGVKTLNTVGIVMSNTVTVIVTDVNAIQEALIFS